MDGAPDIYRYADYRRFLSDYYAYAKASQYGFSFRLFSRRAGLRSSNYLRLVMDGARNLSREAAGKFARGCELRGKDADFFCDLVDYGQATTTAERKRCYERLSSHRKFRNVHKLDPAQAAYHSTWYMPAIRELVRRSDFVEDPKWIAGQLLPRISVQQAQRALSLLLKLQLLERGPSGQLRQAAPLLTTGPGPLGHHIYSYHHMMLERAGAALDELERDERELSCITVGVSQAKFEALKERVRAFRKQLLQDAEVDEATERVVQINFQLFPLSAKPQGQGADLGPGADETAGDAGGRNTGAALNEAPGDVVPGGQTVGLQGPPEAGTATGETRRRQS